MGRVVVADPLPFVRRFALVTALVVIVGGTVLSLRRSPSAGALYLLAGACWLPVVWLQIRMRGFAQDAVKAGTELPPIYWRYLRYWVDEEAGKIFCLIESPSPEASTTVHREAHGLVAEEVYEVKEGS